jgi:hypothetical protein
MMPRFRTASVIYICLVLGSLSAIAYSQPKVDNPKKDVCAEKNELTDRESILKSFAPNDPRWSRALIKQGLIYVRESEQWRRVITTERGSAEKIAADTDFVAALDIYCDLLNLSRKGESKKLRTPEEEERDNIAAARADAASRKARAMAGKTDDRFIPTATSPDSVIPAMPGQLTAKQSAPLSPRVIRLNHPKAHHWLSNAAASKTIPVNARVLCDLDTRAPWSRRPIKSFLPSMGVDNE